MQIPIHPSLIKNQLFLGANKKAVYALSFICTIPLIPAGGLTHIYRLSGFISVLLAIAVWLIGMLILRLIARYDVDFFKIAYGYIRYQKVYAAVTSSKFTCKRSTQRNWNS
jgi:type IV secretory pathway TrbD component